MKIVLYCQHVLGIGHFFRSMELCRALSGHEVIFLAGGARVAAPMPDHVRMVTLPGLMMDSGFKRMYATDPLKTVDQVKAARKKFLWEVMAKERPDVLIVELYPFGRKAFRFELDPLLTGIRDGRLPSCRVICSLRDILVEKTDVDAYEHRVVKTLNHGFDALWIHADPRLVRLDETFSRVKAISVPVVYTGFITPKPPPDARSRIFGCSACGNTGGWSWPAPGAERSADLCWLRRLRPSGGSTETGGSRFSPGRSCPLKAFATLRPYPMKMFMCPSLRRIFSLFWPPPICR